VADNRLMTAILPLVAATLARQRQVEPLTAEERWWMAGDPDERWWTWKNLLPRQRFELAVPLLPPALRTYFGGLDWESDVDWYARSLLLDNAVELRLHGADDTRIVTHVQAWRLRFAHIWGGGDAPDWLADDAVWVARWHRDGNHDLAAVWLWSKGECNADVEDRR